MNGKKAAEKEKLQGAAGFELCYGRLFGSRWPALKDALLAEKNDTEWLACPGSGGIPAYRLDRGSVLAALSLPLAGAEDILDMCAAPGGKSLVLAALMEGGARLVANERSRERMMRLVRVLDGHLSEEARSRVSVTCSDGARLCLGQSECYDRILLDAPCSSERHVLSSGTHLSRWSPSRTRTLAVAQWSLLSSAYRLLRPGGMLLYATCALSPAENDGVVERLGRKFRSAEYVMSLPAVPRAALGHFDGALPSPERTRLGFHVLPDTTGGAGPLYFSLIRKAGSV